MNRIYESVETDIGKYLDINTILKKLEENHIYEDLSEIFLNIHRRESVFTVTELKRISQNKNNNIDLVEQYWVNSDIFRSNLVLIVTSLSTQPPNFFPTGQTSALPKAASLASTHQWALLKTMSSQQYLE
jgi:hypothetical protein